MKLRVRISTGGESERILVKTAGISVVGHVVGLVALSVLPRFGEAPPPARAILGELVPASALLPSAPSQPPSAAMTPSERAAAARRASEEARKPARVSRAPRKQEPRPEPHSKTGAEPEKASPPPEPQVPPPAAPVEPSSERPEADPELDRDAPPDPAGGISFGEGLPDGGGIPSIGSSVFPYDYYRASLVSILRSHWRRPVAPRGLPESIRCRVRFTIIKSGIIQNPAILSPSGNRALDQSALRAVYDSSPLPPLPFQYGHGSVSAEVVFELTPD